MLHTGEGASILENESAGTHRYGYQKSVEILSRLDSSLGWGDNIGLVKKIKNDPQIRLILKDIITSGYVDRPKSRALLVSDSRPLKDKDRMLHRYKNIGFTTLVFEEEDNPQSCRYFNQTELERLQTVPPGYTRCLTRNQAADVLGDGWTVDVIAHILKAIV